jgi:hypothetical protein
MMDEKRENLFFPEFENIPASLVRKNELPQLATALLRLGSSKAISAASPIGFFYNLLHLSMQIWESS